MTFKHYKKRILKDKRSKILNFEESTEKYHYVYRITDLKNGLHYYGVRSSIVSPKEDLGKKYRSSSTDKDFIQRQYDNPEDFKYKIIKTFNNSGDSILYESFIHERMNVSKNDKFINRCNALPWGFSIPGRRFKLSPETIAKRLKSVKNQSPEKKREIRQKIKKTRSMWLEEKRKSIRKKQAEKFDIWWNSLTEEERQDRNSKISKSVKKTAASTPKHIKRKRYEKALKNKDLVNAGISISKGHKKRTKRQKNESSKKGKNTLLNRYGTRNVYDIPGYRERRTITFQATIENRSEEERARIGNDISKRHSGKGNPSALNITVYDANGNVMGRFNGNFCKKMKELGWPIGLLRKSIDTKIPVQYKTPGLAKRYKGERFIGWYAEIVND